MESRKEAREKFRKADQLFREKNFSAALVVLDELDKEFPDTKNVLYPRAMCLARVGRYDEALDLCRQLKVEFGDLRGEKLMAKISTLRKAEADKEKQKKDVIKPAGSAAQQPIVYSLDSNPPPLEERLKGKNAEFSPVFDPRSVGPGFHPTGPSSETLGGAADTLDLSDGSPVIDMAALDDLFAAKPVASVLPPVKPMAPSRTGLYVGIGVGVAVLIVLIALPLALSGKSAPNTAQAPPRSEAPQPGEQAATPQPEAPEIKWLSSLEDASSRAEEGGEDVLLLFYSGSAASPDMDAMDRSVWTDPMVRQFAKNWVCAKVDIDKEPDAKNTFNITKLPTTIVTDYAFEEQYFRQEGYVDTQKFYTAMQESGIVPAPDEQYASIEYPPMPVIALVLLPILFIVATFLPVLFTLLILGRMPEDDLLSSLLSMVLVGIVAPFVGMIVMRASYQLGRLEMLLYYGLLAAHLFVFNWAMTRLGNLDVPFFVYVYGYILMRSH